MLDFNPKTAAEYHCDKHVVKMILETAQLLYTCHWILNADGLPPESYKKSHINHPCAIWVRESLANYLWLCELGNYLCEEYTFRYKKTHKTQQHLAWLHAHPPPTLQDTGITTIRLAMPDQYKHPNPVQAYRNFYIHSKFQERKIVNYTTREWPPFFRATDLHDRHR